MLNSTLILLAEADDRLRERLAEQLTADGATVLLAFDGELALSLAAARRPDLVIVAALPTPAGVITLIRAIRTSGGLQYEPAPDRPILALAPPRDEMAVLRSFEAGADDVMSRGGRYVELRARLRVLLGRAGRHLATASGQRVGPLELETRSRRVWLRGRPIALSAKEFSLLRMLASEPDRVFTRAKLLRDVWGFTEPVKTRTLDSHAGRLRAKLGVDGDAFVIGVWGVGYRLVDRAPAELERAA